jgi:hypothetical protein
VAKEHGGRNFFAPLNQGGAFVEVASFCLSEQQRAALMQSLGTDPTDARVEKFTLALEEAIAAFITMRQVESQQLRSNAVREMLQRLGRGVDELRQRVTALHPQSLRHLDVALQGLRMTEPGYQAPVTPWNPGGHPFFTLSVTAPVGEGTMAELDRLTKSLDTIGQALELVEEQARKNKGGRPQDAPRMVLAQRIAEAFSLHLGERPTTSTEGRFEQVLHVALEAGGDAVQDRDLHRLVRKALKGTKPPSPTP